MARGPLYTMREKETVRQLLEAGTSHRQAAAAVGRSHQIATNVAAEHHIDTGDIIQVKAAHAERDYCKARRIELGNVLFDCILEMAPVIVAGGSAVQMQALSTAFGILTDKRRLEDGDATQRSESYQLRADADSLAGKFQALVERQEQLAALPAPQLTSGDHAPAPGGDSGER